MSTSKSNEDGREPKHAPGERTVDGMARNLTREIALNPRIVEGLNSLYDGIVNDPIPDSIAKILDKLREEERKSETDKTGGDSGNDDA